MDATAIAVWQDEWTAVWHEAEREHTGGSGEELMELVQGNHSANFDLWHEEDKARDPRATDAEIARVKRAIDRLNQQRNDLVEKIDGLLSQKAPASAEDAVLHSETPGMMIDRMSILSLKLFHTAEESRRESAAPEHRARNLERLRILLAQRRDLEACLAEIWREVLAGTRRFKVYRQMKMYNDPELNPAIYGSGKATAGGDGLAATEEVRRSAEGAWDGDRSEGE